MPITIKATNMPDWKKSLYKKEDPLKRAYSLAYKFSTIIFTAMSLFKIDHYNLQQLSELTVNINYMKKYH